MLITFDQHRTDKITLRQNCQRHCTLTYQQQCFELYVRFASGVTRVEDKVNDVTRVNTVLQQCTGAVGKLNIQFEIAYSTTAFEFNTTTALVVLMERCNFVSAGTETEATGHFTL